MNETITRVTMFVPGTPISEAAWNTALQDSGLRIEDGRLEGTTLPAAPEAMFVPQDGEFAKAFSFGTVSADVLAELEAAPGALVILWPIDLDQGRSHLVTAVECLRDAGAIAVRLEQSKLGWDVHRWIELFASDDPSQWHRGAVAFLGGKGTVQSCGMHLFSRPDVQIEAGEQAFAQILNIYQLAEDPVLRSGHTFAPDAETPRRVMERWPDVGYPADHPCHNPYGVWRLGAAGGTARSVGKLEPVFMPTLHALLAAAEEKAARPLTERDVLALRDAGTCITMEPRDAQTLERTRGYADLNPELIWEQWQLVR
ncbi:MAG: hypothetical protein SFX73_12185 [Kofleriaceae bacterium]|nr:hypothetical protein [Kofleriaceae bacterium]